MPEIEFASVPEPKRPERMTPEWAARWETICERLLISAQRRGGHGVRHGDDLVLHAPSRGACIRVYLNAPGKARIDADALAYAADWALADDELEDLERTIRAIMDGRAKVTVATTFEVTGEGGGSAAGGHRDTWVLPAWRAQ